MLVISRKEMFIGMEIANDKEKIVQPKLMIHCNEDDGFNVNKYGNFYKLTPGKKCKKLG